MFSLPVSCSYQTSLGKLTIAMNRCFRDAASEERGICCHCDVLLLSSNHDNRSSNRLSSWLVKEVHLSFTS